MYSVQVASPQRCGGRPKAADGSARHPPGQQYDQQLQQLGAGCGPVQSSASSSSEQWVTVECSEEGSERLSRASRRDDFLSLGQLEPMPLAQAAALPEAVKTATATTGTVATVATAVTAQAVPEVAAGSMPTLFPGHTCALHFGQDEHLDEAGRGVKLEQSGQQLETKETRELMLLSLNWATSATSDSPGGGSDANGSGTGGGGTYCGRDSACCDGGGGGNGSGAKSGCGGGASPNAPTGHGRGAVGGISAPQQLPREGGAGGGGGAGIQPHRAAASDGTRGRAVACGGHDSAGRFVVVDVRHWASRVPCPVPHARPPEDALGEVRGRTPWDRLLGRVEQAQRVPQHSVPCKRATPSRYGDGMRLMPDSAGGGGGGGLLGRGMAGMPVAQELRTVVTPLSETAMAICGLAGRLAAAAPPAGAHDVGRWPALTPSSSPPPSALPSPLQPCNRDAVASGNATVAAMAVAASAAGNLRSSSCCGVGDGAAANPPSSYVLLSSLDRIAIDAAEAASSQAICRLSVGQQPKEVPYYSDPPHIAVLPPS